MTSPLHAARPPSFGWLDVDAEGQRNASAFLTGLEKQGTVDELGFGAVRQVYANLFFPATNTQMRRAIYFLTVPALCQRLQRSGLRGDAARRQLQELENKLRRALEAQSDHDGIIGIQSKDKIGRHPSSIYWGPLWELGILREGIDRGSWLRGLDKWPTGPSVVHDDDGTAHLDDTLGGLWDERALRVSPLPPDDVPASLSPAIDQDAATYLASRFLALDRRRGLVSMTGHLIETRNGARFTHPWDVAPPEPLADDVEDARRYSLFARGATLHYNHLVTRAKAELVGGVADADCWLPALLAWWDHAFSDLTSWDREGFAKRLQRRRTHLLGISSKVPLQFMNRWIDCARQAGNASAFALDETASAIVRRQEAENKPGRTRLTGTDRLDGWKHEEGVDSRYRYQLLYRAPRAAMLVRDIVAPLERDP